MHNVYFELIGNLSDSPVLNTGEAGGWHVFIAEMLEQTNNSLLYFMTGNGLSFFMEKK